MKTIPTFAALALALLAAAAPAAAQNRAEIQMAAELRMLQEQQVLLSLKMDQLTQTLTDALKAISGRLDETGGDMRKQFAGQALTLTNLGNELRVIRENTQNASTRLGQLNEEMNALRGSVNALVSRSTMVVPPPVDPLDPNAPPPQSADAAPPSPPPLPSTVGLSPTVMFNTARSDYAAGQFSLAVSGFESFIRTFSDSELVDDALLYIGDAEQAQNRFEEAIAAYNRVIQNYPNRDQAPWAYYKRGLVQRRLKRVDDARASFEQAVNSGNNEAAALAKQQLDGLLKEAAAQPPAR
jgi:TolA-binding protein